MPRLFKTLLIALLAFGSVDASYAFSLLGPYTSWQTQYHGYNRNDDGQIGGPMNTGEEYRWNTPIITYGFDEPFLNYFGSNGVAAVEEAMAVLNDVPPISQLSADLSEFPYDTLRQNYTVSSLDITDVKSTVLAVMMEQMGLASPELFVWTLRDVKTFSDPDGTNWIVIQRNFDPITFEPSSYVNGGSPWVYSGGSLKNGIDALKDPDGFIPHVFNADYANSIGNFHHSVASFGAISLVGGGNLRSFGGGFYFTGLTVDDVGGLRYLYRTNNYNYETLFPPSDIQEVFTNTSLPGQLETLDLSLLITRSQRTTNTPADLLGFPGYTNLVLASTNAYLTNIVTTNITTYFTNFPYALGAALTQVFATNLVTNVTTGFDYTFANVVTNTYSSTQLVTEQVVEVVPASNYTPGSNNSVVTNVTSTSTYITNIEAGDFYILPPNVLSYSFISTQLVSVIATTNEISTVFANFVAYTNTNAVPIELDTIDLALFTSQTRQTTNTPTELLGLYPDLLITKTNAHLADLVTTNIFSLFTNYPTPFPPGPTQVFFTNYITNVTLVYDYDFANVVTNNFVAHQTAEIRTVDLEPAPNYTPGSANIITNVISDTTVDLALPGGDVFIVPTNLVAYSVVSNVLNGVSYTTNVDFFSPALLMTNEVPSLQLLSTIDYTTFNDQARTNDPAALLALYPDLLITSNGIYFTNIVVTNFVRYLTNYPWEPAGSVPHDATNFVLSTNIATNYLYSFGNVVTNHLYGSGIVTLEEQHTVYDPYAAAGSPPTVETVTYKKSSNYFNGDIYIVPTNLFGYDILYTQLITVTPETNVLSTSTNLFQTTNVDQSVIIRYATNYYYGVYPIQILTTNDYASNTFGMRREVILTSTTNVYEVYPVQLLTTNEFANTILGTHRQIITYFTNSIFGYYPVALRDPGIPSGLRGGVDKIYFVRHPVSITGTNFYGTNFNTSATSSQLLAPTSAGMISVPNNWTDSVLIESPVGSGNFTNVPAHQTLRRVNSTPDILFRAADLGTFGNTGTPIPLFRTTTGNWVNNGNRQAGQFTQDGPGVISRQREIWFNKVGSYFFTQRVGKQNFIGNNTPLNVWGSFDGTTNPPVIYPSSVSVSNLEQQVLSP